MNPCLVMRVKLLGASLLLHCVSSQPCTQTHSCVITVQCSLKIQKNVSFFCSFISFAPLSPSVLSHVFPMLFIYLLCQHFSAPALQLHSLQKYQSMHAIATEQEFCIFVAPTSLFCFSRYVHLLWMQTNTQYPDSLLLLLL